jgi:hypothetical protein
VSTSDYLKVQADLLNAVELLRRLKLDDFIRKADEAAAAGLVDHYGRPVMTDALRMKRLAEGAQRLLQGEGHDKTKSAKSHLGRCA